MLHLMLTLARMHYNHLYDHFDIIGYWPNSIHNNIINFVFYGRKIWFHIVQEEQILGMFENKILWINFDRGFYFGWSFSV